MPWGNIGRTEAPEAASEEGARRYAGPMRLGGSRTVLAVLALAALVITACSAQASNERTAGPSSSQGGGANTTGGNTATTASSPSTPASPADFEIGTAPKQQDEQTLSYSYGPIDIAPGQNNITVSNLQVPKPTVDGYIVGIRANLKREDGTVPPVDVIHLHHGVWLKLGAGGSYPTRRRRPAGADQAGGGDAASPTGGDAGAGANASAGGSSGGSSTGSQFGQLFFASGEEKTAMVLPAGYGFAYKATDMWVINYMLHNLLSTPDKVSITYDIDFIPADSAGAKSIKEARPLWMDVQNGHIYPVFDVLKGSGTDGTFTYPDQADDPYKGGPPLNQWTVDRDSVLLATAGHLHPGGLHTDMYVTRAGAGASATPEAKASITGDKAHIFRSDAAYYEPAGAVSWDVSMSGTQPDWRVSVKKGDVLSISATYDTKRASWYESMGIMILWMTDPANASGVDPFQKTVDTKGQLTHGHLPENDNHGGAPSTEFANAQQLPDGAATNQVDIWNFVYSPGDLGTEQSVPTVKAGDSLNFINHDNPQFNGVWHTITACKAPCNQSTGVAYPLADADVQFDSGELGTGGPPTADRIDWTVPNNLPTGTYTYFCRIHPSMRGSFKVVPGS